MTNPHIPTDLPEQAQAHMHPDAGELTDDPKPWNPPPPPEKVEVPTGPGIEAAPPEDHDWSLVDHPIVSEVVAAVAQRVGMRYGGVTTPDDQYQEAVIRVASAPSQVRAYVDDPLLGKRALYRWLHHNLLDGVATDASRSARNTELPTEEGS